MRIIPSLSLAASLSFALACAVAEECTEDTRPYILGPLKQPLGNAGETFSVKIKDNAKGNRASCTWFRDSEDPNGITIFALRHEAHLRISEGLVDCTIPPTISSIIGDSNGKVRVTVAVYEDGAEVNSNCTSRGSEKPITPGTGSFTFFWYRDFYSRAACSKATQPYLEKTTTPSVAPGQILKLSGKWRIAPLLYAWCSYEWNGTRISTGKIYEYNINPEGSLNYDTGEISCEVPTPPDELVPQIYGKKVSVSVRVTWHLSDRWNVCRSYVPSNNMPNRGKKNGTHVQFTMLEPPSVVPTTTPTKRPVGDGGSAASRPAASLAALLCALVLFVLV